MVKKLLRFDIGDKTNTQIISTVEKLNDTVEFQKLMEYFINKLSTNEDTTPLNYHFSDVN